MSVFLIQTNGREISEDAAPEYIRGAKGPTYVDEPLQHHRYFNANPYWKREGYERREAWESATEGDTVFLYCSSSVDEYPTCISHILPIRGKQINSEGALLEFETPIEIEPKINYQEIHRLVDQGEFSEKMGNCGQQGFNFTQIANSDLDKVNEITSQLYEAEVWQAVSVALERVKDEDTDLLRFDVHERSITHRLGMYLQEAARDSWDVDVEYNRIGGDDTKEVPEELLTSGSQGRVVPDVIIHRRGSGDHNVLVVEAKKSGNSDGGDRQKIRAYMQHLDYDFGLFVRFDTGQDTDDPEYSGEWKRNEQTIDYQGATDSAISTEPLNTFTIDDCES